MSKAMGMIETKGLIGSIHAGDAMVKAANVEILKQEFIDGGIVTIFIVGDVGAVQAAVDAGRVAAESVGELLGAHVIPRPDDAVQKMFAPKPSDVEGNKAYEQTKAAVVKQEDSPPTSN